MEGLTPDADVEGTTPLEPDERAGLIPTFVTTRADLNLVEQEGIAGAVVDMRRRRPSVTQILDDAFMRALHRRMFGWVWRWEVDLGGQCGAPVKASRNDTFAPIRSTAPS